MRRSALQLDAASLKASVPEGRLREMLFIVACADKPHSLDGLKEDRPAYPNSLGRRAKIAGAPVGLDRQTPIGVKRRRRGVGRS